MRSSIISLSLVAVIGIVIGLLLQSPESSTGSSTSSANNTMQASTDDAQPPALAKLSQQLQQEIIAREALQKEVTLLSEKLAAMSLQDVQDPTDNPGNYSANNSTSATGPADAAHNPTEGAWFNQQALIDAGMTQMEAEQLKVRFEEMELAKLYLRDQAVREGWSGGKRYREERQKLESKTEDIKQELDEKAYDAYLFASGQSNRVAVQSVLSGSAAGNAGMLAGDQVLRYASERIYNWRDLRNATTQGDLTETVAIEILRDNKKMELYVQRGPLGIRMNSISIAP